MGQVTTVNGQDKMTPVNGQFKMTPGYGERNHWTNLARSAINNTQERRDATLRLKCFWRREVRRGYFTVDVFT